jgi:hypothetical protein
MEEKVPSFLSELSRISSPEVKEHQWLTVFGINEGEELKDSSIFENLNNTTRETTPPPSNMAKQHTDLKERKKKEGFVEDSEEKMQIKRIVTGLDLVSIKGKRRKDSGPHSIVQKRSSVEGMNTLKSTSKAGEVKEERKDTGRIERETVRESERENESNVNESIESSEAEKSEQELSKCEEHKVPVSLSLCLQREDNNPNNMKQVIFLSHTIIIIAPGYSISSSTP